MQDVFKESGVFGSSDLAQVATLAMYFPIKAMDRGKVGKVSFFFKRSTELDALLEEYWRGDIRVEPKVFFEQIKKIESLPKKHSSRHMTAWRRENIFFLLRILFYVFRILYFLSGG